MGEQSIKGTHFDFFAFLLTRKENYWFLDWSHRPMGLPEVTSGTSGDLRWWRLKPYRKKSSRGTVSDPRAKIVMPDNVFVPNFFVFVSSVFCPFVFCPLSSIFNGKQIRNWLSGRDFCLRLYLRENDGHCVFNEGDYQKYVMNIMNTLHCSSLKNL